MPALIFDGPKEIIEGELQRKFKEADRQLKQPEPYSPLSNMADGNIYNLKTGAVWKMIKSLPPKQV